MEPAYRYENFVSSAFGLAHQKRVGRFEDPAGFADTDTFTAGNLSVVKAAVVYAMGIYSNHIEEKPEGMYEECRNFYSAVICAENVLAVAEIVERFETDVVDRHFEREDGILKPR